MKIELLPSSVPVSDVQYLTTYLINDEIAIDCGSLGLLADLERQKRVKHIFITHEHIDHIATLPLVLSNSYEPGVDCVEVLAMPDVLQFLRNDIFNGRVWPDFFNPTLTHEPMVRVTPLELFKPIRRCNVTITPVPVSHGVPSIGFIVEDAASAVVFPSDTGPTEAIWSHAAKTNNLKAVFLEASFPEKLIDLALVCGHLCPSTFAIETRKITTPVRWMVVHRKPSDSDQVAKELESLGIAGIEMVRCGVPYWF
ncbi:MAG: 3',5'-cyclic-nucleotide phosphodiesterase [Planctomycetota bacterium]|jgi:cAMP phosphodiesterase|nr:3',5'-cyclic-nucleotide phosphodiesterase [Planctomycetia bacterium]RLS56882.1 MAG: 3',5'-cyclic-nucleotide phosphodiesterase [Planctomycetota bacterium]RLS97668.1 MAG: 3',5'-cyclic-nucleotide phosphodiesterase [Planctomycetota bacterium]